MREIGHFIGGQHVAGTSGKFGDVFNPASGELSARVSLADTSEVNKAVAAAARYAGVRKSPAQATSGRIDQRFVESAV